MKQNDDEFTLNYDPNPNPGPNGPQTERFPMTKKLVEFTMTEEELKQEIEENLSIRTKSQLYGKEDDGSFFVCKYTENNTWEPLDEFETEQAALEAVSHWVDVLSDEALENA